MSRIVHALCEHMVFDNATGILHYPGNEYDIDLDTDAALSFRLKSTERAYARDAQKNRSVTRRQEYQDMKEQGFATIIELRKYRKMEVEDAEAAAEMKADLGIVKTEVAKK